MKRKPEDKTASKDNEGAPDAAGGPKLMSSRERIEREVEATLRSLDTISPPRHRPDFYAEVAARIREADAPGRTAGASLLRPRVLIPAALAFLIIVNIVTAVVLYRRSDADAAGRRQSMAALAEEYGLGSNAISSYWK